MNEQEEKNKSDSFAKQQLDKGKDKLKDKAKKKQKKKVIIALITRHPVLAIALVVAIVTIILLCCALYIVDKWKEENVNNAKQGAIVVAYADSESTNSGNYGDVDETKLVFIGDSWIEGLGNQSCTKTSYVYGATGKNADYFNGLTMNIPSDASGIVIEFGLNNPSGYATTQKLAGDLHKSHSNLPIFILKTSHVASGFSSNGINAATMNSNLDKYNQEMQKWCEEKDYATYLDSATETINDNNGNGLLIDPYKAGNSGAGLYHLSTTGYEAWYKDIIEAIRTNGGSNNTITENSNSNSDANKIVIQPNKNKTGYKLSYNDDSDNLEKIKNKLRHETSSSPSEFSDFELAVLGALMDYGANLDYYTEEQLHCFPAFIKAEACTQYLDLRPNSEKLKNDEYVPAKIDELEENEVPGVILVQRTNTNGNSPEILEYKVEEEFNKLLEKNSTDAMSYFTVNDKGDLIIAKWEKENVTVNIKGEGLPDDIKTEVNSQATNGDKYTITTEPIAYSEYIKKYTMPFEFLNQLLVIIEKPEFCMELVNYVLDSKIVINIQEEETFTETDETRNYVIHNKDEKRVNYEVKASGLEYSIEQGNNYFLEYDKDDKNEPCTNYSSADPVVTIHTEYTSHSYVFEIIEADTWLAHYIKTYKPQEKKIEKTNNSADDPGEYKKNGDDINGQSGEGDKDAEKFIETKASDYKSKLVRPTVTVRGYTDEEENNFKEIMIGDIELGAPIPTTATGLPLQNPYQEIKNEDGDGTGRYNLPDTIIVSSNKIAATDTTKEIPSIPYKIKKDLSESYYQPQDIDIIRCNVTNLNIKNFQKIESHIKQETTVTEYPSDPNPTTKTHIYATKSGEPGQGHGDKNTVYEKFLAAYNSNVHARNQLNSIDDWLYEMMEGNENTVELVDIVKYLLYMYDGKNRGVTELKDFETIFNPDDMTKATSVNSLDQFIRFLHSWEGGGTIKKNKKGEDCYVVQSDGGGRICSRIWS